MTFNLAFLKEDMTFEEFEEFTVDGFVQPRVIMPCCFEVESPEYELYFVDASNCFFPDDKIYGWYLNKLGGKIGDFRVHDEREFNIKTWLSLLEDCMISAGIRYYAGEYWNDEESATRVYTGLSTFQNIQDCILHYALTNGYSSAFCEHCGKPFLRKNGHSKYCTRYSPLSRTCLTGLADRHCEDAVKTARGKLSNLYEHLMSPYYSEHHQTEKRPEKYALQNLHDKYVKKDTVNTLKPDCMSLMSYYSNLIRFEHSKNRAEFMEKEFVEGMCLRECRYNWRDVLV